MRSAEMIVWTCSYILLVSMLTSGQLFPGPPGLRAPQQPFNPPAFNVPNLNLQSPNINPFIPQVPKPQPFTPNNFAPMSTGLNSFNPQQSAFNPPQGPSINPNLFNPPNGPSSNPNGFNPQSHAINPQIKDLFEKLDDIELPPLPQLVPPAFHPPPSNPHFNPQAAPFNPQQVNPPSSFNPQHLNPQAAPFNPPPGNFPPPSLNQQHFNPQAAPFNLPQVNLPPSPLNPQHFNPQAAPFNLPPVNLPPSPSNPQHNYPQAAHFNLPPVNLPPSQLNPQHFNAPFNPHSVNLPPSPFKPQNFNPQGTPFNPHRFNPQNFNRQAAPFNPPPPPFNAQHFNQQAAPFNPHPVNPPPLPFNPQHSDPQAAPSNPNPVNPSPSPSTQPDAQSTALQPANATPQTSNASGFSSAQSDSDSSTQPDAQSTTFQQFADATSQNSNAPELSSTQSGSDSSTQPDAQSTTLQQSADATSQSSNASGSSSAQSNSDSSTQPDAQSTAFQQSADSTPQSPNASGLSSAQSGSDSTTQPNTQPTAFQQSADSTPQSSRSSGFSSAQSGRSNSGHSAPVKLHAGNPLKDFRIVCIFNNQHYIKRGFSPDNIKPHLCTHINYEFAILDSKTYEMTMGEPDVDMKENLYQKTLDLRKDNPGLKVMLSLGGWLDSDKKYSEMVALKARRKNFIEKAISFLKAHEFDGMDLAWEYPNCWQGALGVNPKDKYNFVALLKEMKPQFEKNGLILSVSVGSIKREVEAAYDVRAVSNTVDYINVMTYDMHGPWEPVTGHHTQFEALPGDVDPYLNVKGGMNVWIEKGANRKKLNMGLAFYAKTFTLKDPNQYGLGAPALGVGHLNTTEAGFLLYNEICQYLNAGNWTELEDKRAGFFAYNGNQWVCYDPPIMVVRKVKYAMENGMGGVLIKDMSGDDYEGNCFKGMDFVLTRMIRMQMIHKIKQMHL